MQSSPSNSDPDQPITDINDVVLACELEPDQDDASRVAAVDALACVAQRTRMPLVLWLDAVAQRAWDPIMASLVRHHARVVPFVIYSSVAQVPSLPEPGDSITMFATLAQANLLARWDDACFAGIRGGGAAERIALAALASNLRQAVARVQVGFVRVRAALPVPDGFDFAFEWPPYMPNARSGDEHVAADYAVIATAIARTGGTTVMSPSVPFSTSAQRVLDGAQTRLIDVSPLKIAYAIDAARRFVHNRAGNGIPFWVLRIDPAERSDIAGAVGKALDVAMKPEARDDVPAWAASSSRNGARVAVVLHLYYPDLWDEFAAAIGRLSEPCDVYVSCPLRARDAVGRMVHSSFPDAVVAGVRNRGRDVLPFLHWLALPGADRYVYVLKLHSKKSAHIADPALTPTGGGDDWRRRALDGLVGTRDNVASILSALDARPDVGIVGPAGLLYDQIAWRYATGDLIATLRERIGITAELEGVFPAGTMFWARVAALRLLMRVPAAALDFEREAGQTDATLHHAYERLFPLAATAAGFRTIDTAALLRTGS